VEFLLLGDVEARLDGSRVEIGHGRQRCVLAALLIDANQPVPVDRLLDRVWGDRPPDSARGTLYSYLSRLRRILSVVEDLVIRRQPGGYVVTVDPMAVDLHRFHLLTGQARSAGDDRAAALLEQALGLWRGEAFATLDTPWLNGVRSALNRQRRAAELDRNDLALRRGEHARLLGELAERAAADPLDERLAGQFMLALYRCGRQADALDLFQRVRVSLAEELGAGPGQPLCRLHRHIMTADPAVAAPGVTVSVARSGVPHQLPAPPRTFTGRARQLAELSGAVDTQADRGTMSISVIGGTGGMGKTWLAVRWAHDNLERFPDGQLCVNLRGYDPSGEPVPPAVALRGLLDALAVDPAAIPAGLDGQVALYRRLVAGRRMLVLLDNARDTAQVAPLLPASPTCTVLVTSRHRLADLVAAHGARPLSLDVLTDTEASELLGYHLGDARMATEPGPVAALIRQCAGLPLALSVVAARAALQPDLPLAALADELLEASALLDALNAGELAVNVRAVLSCSFHALPTAAAQVFALLGSAPGPDISLAAGASLAALSTTRTRVLLRELANAHLVHEHLAGRYRMHDLVRLYAAEQARTVDTRAACHRLLDHYLHAACAADRLLDPHRDPIVPAAARPGVVPVHLTDHGQALDWFTTEHPALVAAVRESPTGALDTHLWQLARALGTFFWRRGHWHDWASSHLTALAAAERTEDRAGLAHTHRGIAHAYTYLDRNADAESHARCALELFGALGDRVGQANAYRILARVHARQQHYRPALGYGQQALELYRATDHQHGEATALNAVGWFHAHLGDLHQALAYCRRSLRLFRQLDDPDGTAYVLDSVGYIHRHLGHFPTAVTCYQRAVELFRDLGNNYLEATVSVGLGDTHHAAGDNGPARVAWLHALEILDQLSHPEAVQVRARLAPVAVPVQANDPPIPSSDPARRRRRYLAG
jgi:DNA-binding SARP family transcriptional activator